MSVLFYIGLAGTGIPLATIIYFGIKNRKHIAKQIGPFYTGHN